MNKYNVERFITAQNVNYAQALQELKNGCKTSHWMWYVFPQLAALGQSSRAIFYGMEDEQEAKEYCANPLLYTRYIECCKALDSLQETNPEKIMGEIDAKKLRSSLTLFYVADEKNRVLYQRLINKFYQGEWDRLTLSHLQKNQPIEMRLNAEPFSQIKRGEKTVEVRLYDEKRRTITVGQRIRFRHAENENKQLTARVIALHTFDTFAKLFASQQFEKCGFIGYTNEEAVNCMYKFYTPEEESKWGVVGIEILLEENNERV